jgi:hypothetical protein
MKLQFNRSGRWLVAAGFLLLAAMATEVSTLDESTLVATHWKVRPSPARNYRRFYRYQQPQADVLVPGATRDYQNDTDRATISELDELAQRTI